jgi:hypothetical protein
VLRQKQPDRNGGTRKHNQPHGSFHKLLRTVDGRSLQGTNYSGLGKTRHGLVLQKVGGEIGFRGQKGNRWLSGKIAEVAYQMGLVVVSALHGGIHPGGTRGIQGLKHALESLDTAEKLGCDAELVFEPPLKLTQAQAEKISHNAHVWDRIGRHDSVYGGWDQAVGFVALFRKILQYLVERGQLCCSRAQLSQDFQSLVQVC